MEGLPPSVGELANAFQSVNINDVQELDSTSDVDRLNLSGGSEVKCNQNCLTRYLSFPSPAKMISDYSSSDKEDESTHMTSEKLIFHEPAPPVKLVSAMKGSREKQQGFPPEKLQVTWAPDVYDPTPTSLSHAGQRGPRQQKQSRKDKRRGKKGNKGKDLSRGDGGKEKKKKKKKRSSQSNAIPSTGTSYTVNNELDHKSEMVENFGFGVPDSCGSSSSSFFKLSMTNAHYPVAEAL